MSPIQAQWLVRAMICFGSLVAIGWVVLSHLYSRLGYPPIPDWVLSVHLSDSIDTVHDKLTPAFDEGFKITQRDHETIIIVKRLAEPLCSMEFEARRGRGGSWQKFSVRCPHHRWLSRSSSSGRNW